MKVSVVPRHEEIKQVADECASADEEEVLHPVLSAEALLIDQALKFNRK